MSAVPDWLETFWHHAQTNDHVCGHQPSTKATLVRIAEYCLMKKHLITSVSLLTLALSSHAHANDSLIEQVMLREGMGHTAEVDQTQGRGGNSVVDQRGRSNLARVTQSDSVVTTTPVVNDAKITQRGRLARGVIEQTATGTTAVQKNTATITQYSVMPVNPNTGFAVSARIEQNGKRHVSTITQGSAGEKVSKVRAKNIQKGVRNTSQITQLGETMTAIVEQSGKRGKSSVTQDGMNQYAQLTDTGMFNKSSITQGGHSQKAFVVQGASGNTSRIGQKGSSHTAMVFQTASAGNLSIIRQRGTNNTATVRQ